MSTPAGKRSERYPLALLDHVVAEPALLRKWALQLKRPSRIPLAVYPGGAEAEQGRQLLAEAIARSGSDMQLDTDIYLLPGAWAPEVVASRATGLYTWDTELPAPFASLYRRPDAYIQACRHWILSEADVADPPPGPPDFVGIGCQRAGTTWWLKLLREHPEIESISWKELHFFDSMTDLPPELYRRIFRRAEGRLTGEFTPEYMFYPWIPPLLQRAVPEAKLLIMLRDPVARYCSGLAFDRQRETPDDPQSRRNHFERGLYARQLERVFALFPRDQVLVLQYERCVLDPADQYRRTLEFLGVMDASHPPQAVGKRLNATKTQIDLDRHTRRELEDAYQRDAERLVELLPDLEVSLWPSIAGTPASVVG